MTHERKLEMYHKLLSSQIPCMVYSRSQDPDQDMLDLCNHYGVSCLVSDKTTSDLMAEIQKSLAANIESIKLLIDKLKDK